MNSNIAQGNWQQIKGAVIAQWGRATGDRSRVHAGRHLQMMGAMHAAYGRVKDEVGRQIDRVVRRSSALQQRSNRPARQTNASWREKFVARPRRQRVALAFSSDVLLRVSSASN